MSADIQNIWRILTCEADSVIELRAISKQPGMSTRSFIFKAKEFPSEAACKTAFERKAVELNDAGFNCYFVINPINPDFSGRSVKDADIACRTTLLVDIDRDGDTKDPATDEELKQCKLVANLVVQWLRENEEDPLAVVMSGNGYHLFYRLDLPNNDSSTHAIKALLNGLAAKFDNEHAKIDQCVYNASRIAKIPGTVSYKGAATDYRPFRRSYLCDLESEAPKDIALPGSPAIDENKLRWLLGGLPLEAAAKSFIRRLGKTDDLTRILAGKTPPAETPREVANLRADLANISADCDYDVYMRVIWAIQSTSWSCADDICREWSESCPARYDRTTLEKLIASYNPDLIDAPTVGTIKHLAKLGESA